MCKFGGMKGILISTVAMSVCLGASCTGSRANSGENGGSATEQQAQQQAVAIGRTPASSKPARYLPRAVIYKTNGDYNNNVTVRVNPAGDALETYPGPGDVGENSVPVALKGGWLWDRRGGIGPGTRFLTYTYEQYHALPQVPEAETLMKSIIPGARVTAAYRLPILQTEATPDKIDYIIEHGLQYAEEIVPQYQLQAPSDK